MHQREPHNHKPNASEVAKLIQELVAKGYDGTKLAEIIKATRQRCYIAKDLEKYLGGQL